MQEKMLETNYTFFINEITRKIGNSHMAEELLHLAAIAANNAQKNSFGYLEILNNKKLSFRHHDFTVSSKVLKLVLESIYESCDEYKEVLKCDLETNNTILSKAIVSVLFALAKYNKLIVEPKSKEENWATNLYLLLGHRALNKSTIGFIQQSLAIFDFNTICEIKDNLENFLLLWQQETYINRLDNNYPLIEANESRDYKSKNNGIRQVDFLTGFNVILLLLCLSRIGRENPNCFENRLDYYPCGKPNYRTKPKRNFLIYLHDRSKCLSDSFFSELIGEHLENALLQNANLKGLDLSKANLKNANLRGANLDEANLTEADLSDTNLNNTSFFKSILTKANLENAILYGADLQEALGTWVNFSNIKYNDRTCWHQNKFHNCISLPTTRKVKNFL